MFKVLLNIQMCESVEGIAGESPEPEAGDCACLKGL